MSERLRLNPMSSMNYLARHRKGLRVIVLPAKVQRVFVEKSKTFCYKCALAQAATGKYSELAGSSLFCDRRESRVAPPLPRSLGAPKV